MHLHSVQARVRDHYSRDPFTDRVEISRHVDVHQIIPVHDCVILIDAIDGATISHKMLRTSCNFRTSTTQNNTNQIQPEPNMLTASLESDDVFTSDEQTGSYWDTLMELLLADQV